MKPAKKEEEEKKIVGVDENTFGDILDIEEIIEEPKKPKKQEKTKKVDKVAKELTIPQISEKEIIEKFNKDKKFREDLIKLANGDKKEKDNDIDSLVGALKGFIKTLQENGESDNLNKTPKSLQSVIAKAHQQSIRNMKNYRKKFKEESQKGEIGDLTIYRGYAKRLPTRSMSTIDGNGSKTVKTIYEIGFRGVTLSFEIGKKYKNVPKSIVDFIYRKLAANQDVVNSETIKDLSEQGYEARKNAA